MRYGQTATDCDPDLGRPSASDEDWAARRHESRVASNHDHQQADHDRQYMAGRKVPRNLIGLHEPDRVERDEDPLGWDE